MGKKRIQAIMKELQRQHKIVISILHDMDFVAETFDRAIVFAKGDALLDGDVKSVFKEKDILRRHIWSSHTPCSFVTNLDIKKHF